MKISYTIPVFICFLLLIACAGNGDNWTAEHGYGPVTEPLELGEISESKAFEGSQIFASYCAACHTMTASISGPALGRTVNQRTPEFIVNYTLEPRENRMNHPIGQELAEQYSANMTNTGVSLEEAIAVLEYMRFFAEFGEDPGGETEE